MKSNKGIPYIGPDDSLYHPLSFTDPFGSYTGVPEDEHEKPVQDADDL